MEREEHAEVGPLALDGAAEVADVGDRDAPPGLDREQDLPGLPPPARAVVAEEEPAVFVSDEGDSPGWGGGFLTAAGS